MNKDQKLLEEAYKTICESTREPEYFGPKQTRQMWMSWLKDLPHEVHEDGSVSVDGNVIFHSNFGKNKMDRVPFNFREVTGQYNCSGLGLTSLEGSPRIVTGTFDCTENELTSLKGAPEIAKGSFRCRANQLTSLIGAPKEVGKGFYCHHNKITSLEGAPEVVGEIFTSDQFEDKDYRKFVRDRKIKQKVDKELDKDLNVDLGDFS